MLAFIHPILYVEYVGVIAALLVLLALVYRGAVRREGKDGVGAQVLSGIGWGGALLAALPLILVVVALGGDLVRYWMPKMLLLAGLGQFLVLVASFQVPARLEWKEELARLRPLNRKLMWTYGGSTALTVVAFGVLTLLLRDEMLRGDKAAVALAAFIGVYWAARIGVDVFHFRHEDWPKGRQFGIGHALLMLMFTFLTATYLGLVVVGLSGGLSWKPC